jgi:hypothetical protein
MRCLQKYQSFHDEKQEEDQGKVGTEKVLQEMPEEYAA